MIKKIKRINTNPLANPKLVMLEKASKKKVKKDVI